MRPAGETSATFVSWASADSQIFARKRSPVNGGHGNRDESRRTFIEPAIAGAAYDSGPLAIRILVLTPRLPWPPADGGRVAMARLAQPLAGRGVAVEVLSLNPRQHRGTPAGPVPIHAVDIDTSRWLVPALRASTSSVPLIAARFVSREFRDALRATLLRFNPGIVQIESPFLLPY